MSQYSAQEHLESLKKFKIKEIEKNTFILVVGYTGSSVGVTSTIANTSTTANTIANTTTNTYEIYLILTENFPSQKPTLLLPSYSHSLIKDNEIQFNYNTLLGEIFTEIETKFRVETPILKSIDLVDYHKVKELLKDNELSSLLHSTPEIRRASFVKEKVLESNASQAGTTSIVTIESNLSRSSQIQLLKQRIETLQTLNSSHRSILDNLLHLQQQELIRFGSEYVTEQIRRMVATSEDMSELSASAFLEGKLTEEEFLKAFKESRKLYHLRQQKFHFI